MVSASYVSAFLSQVTSTTLPAVWQAASQILQASHLPSTAENGDRLAFLRDNADQVSGMLAPRWGDFVVSFVRARLDHPPVLERRPEAEQKKTAHSLARGLASVLGDLFSGHPVRNRTEAVAGFATAAEALASLTQRGAIDVYGFGEYHPRDREDYGSINLIGTLTAPTSLEHFAADMIPHLVREAGVSVFGLEYLPAASSEKGSPVKKFLRTGDFSTSLLSDLYLTTDPLGAMMVLESLRRLIDQGHGLEVHGLLDDHTSRDHHLHHLSGGAFGLPCERYFPVSIEAINQNALKVTKGARDAGKKVALYTGAAHSAIRPSGADRDYSYVPGLRTLLAAGDRYAEMRVLVPEYVAGLMDNGEDQALAEQSPRRGVSLFRRGSREHALVYPGSFRPPPTIVLLLR